jgi:hypothetical protein
MYTVGKLDAMYGRPHVFPGGTPADHAEYIEGFIEGERIRIGWESRFALKEANGWRNDPSFDPLDLEGHYASSF